MKDLLTEACALVESSQLDSLETYANQIPRDAKLNGKKIAEQQIANVGQRESMLLSIPQDKQSDPAYIGVVDAAYKVYQEQVRRGRNQILSWIIALSIFNRCVFSLLTAQKVDYDWVKKMSVDAINKPLRFVLMSILINFVKSVGLALIAAGAAVGTAQATGSPESEFAVIITFRIWCVMATTIAQIKLLYKMATRNPEQFDSRLVTTNPPYSAEKGKPLPGTLHASIDEM